MRVTIGPPLDGQEVSCLFFVPREYIYDVNTGD